MLYSVYVTYDGNPEQALASDYAFRASASDLDYWGLIADLGELDVCNFQIGTGLIHRADTNENGCVEQSEIIKFINRWKISSTDVTMIELMEAIGLWKSGTGC